MTGSYPAARTAFSAARNALDRPRRQRELVLAKILSPGFGDSFFASLSARVTVSGRSSLYLATIARASASVVGSGTVGPEPIADGSSCGTSEIAKVASRAG